MKQIRTVQDIKRLGRILSVWAHPDDESYLAGGIMAAAVQNGQEVYCVTATRGEAGSQDELKWPSETLGQVRQAELKKALNTLGVTKHCWLDYLDGCCSEVDTQEAVNKIISIINEFKPDSIITFGPDGITGHPDHSSISKWVKLSVQGTNIIVYHAVHTYYQYNEYLKQADEALNIFFNIDNPPLVNEEDCHISFVVPPDICVKKFNAIAAMPSQTEMFFKLFGRDFIRKSFSSEFFIKDVK